MFLDDSFLFWTLILSNSNETTWDRRVVLARLYSLLLGLVFVVTSRQDKGEKKWVLRFSDFGPLDKTAPLLSVTLRHHCSIFQSQPVAVCEQSSVSRSNDCVYCSTGVVYLYNVCMYVCMYLLQKVASSF